MGDGETERRLKCEVDFHRGALFCRDDEDRARNREERPQDNAPAERFNLAEENTGPKNGQQRIAGDDRRGVRRADEPGDRLRPRQR